MRTGRKSSVLTVRGQRTAVAASCKSFAAAGLYWTGLGRLTCAVLVGSRRVRALQCDEPAFTVFARSTGEHDLQVQPVDVPGLLRSVSTDFDRVRFEQVVGRIVFAMIILDAAEERELVI